MRQDLQWYALLVTGCVATALAYWGFLLEPALHGGADTPLNAFSGLFRFLTFRFVVPKGVAEPLALEIARYLWVVVIGASSSKAVLLALRKDIKISLARYRSDHIIVAGLSPIGLRIIDQQISTGQRVVSIDHSNTSEAANVAWQAGATVLAGDSSNRKILTAAGTTRAKAILVCEQTVGRSLATIGSAYELILDKLPRRHPLIAIPFVDDFKTQRELAANDLWLPKRDRLHLRPYSLSTLAVESHLRTYQPRNLKWRQETSAITHLILGASPVAIALGDGLLRQFQPSEGDPPRLHFVAAADERLTSFMHGLAKSPLIGKVTYLEAQEHDIDIECIFKNVSERADALDAVFVCTTSTERNLALASSIRLFLDRQGWSAIPVHVYVDRQSEAELAYRPHLEPGVHIFGEWFAHLNRVLEGDRERERRAQRVHESFGAALNPTNKGHGKSWEESPESHRASSRAFADHIDVKLRWAGLEPDAVTRMRPEDLGDMLVEGWAKMEHRRWLAELILAGWQYGEPTSIQLRRHARLVTWDRLDEALRESTREMVRAIPKLI